MDDNKIELNKINFPDLNSTQKEFVKKGYVITDVENKENLVTLRNYVGKMLQTHFNKKVELKNLHKLIKSNDVNKFRLNIANSINQKKWTRPLFFKLAKNKLSELVGNELAMQNKAILSIQMPNDESSVLPMHCDVFAGESPFQINQWVPLVNASESMSMFFLPKKYSLKILKNFDKYRKSGFQKIFDEYKNKFIWLNVPFGKQVFFCSNFFHGNTVNNENKTRWSFNIRYVNLLNSLTTEEKSIFNFYKPISLKPSTRLGLEFSKIKFEKILSTVNIKKVKKKKLNQLQTYVSSRNFGEWRIPVPMQNIILKDYCDKHNYIFKVSMNELNIEDSLTVLNNIFSNLNENEGILMCSYKMLSSNVENIIKIIGEGVKKGVEWHFVFENLIVNDLISLNNFVEMIIFEKKTKFEK